MWKENNMFSPNYCQCHNNEYDYLNSEYNNYNDNFFNNNYYDNNENNGNDVVEDFDTYFGVNHHTEDYNSSPEDYHTNQENYSYNFFNQEGLSQSQSQSQYTFQNNFQGLENEKNNEVDEKFMIESEKLENIGYDIVVVRGDGNCLFRSVAEQLEGNEENYQKFREICVDYMINNKEVFIPFLDDSISIDEYIEKISKDGEWGGNLEIYALSMALEANFCIYIPDKPCSVVKNWENPKQNIFLIYHDGKHYNSLRKYKCIKNSSDQKEIDVEKKEYDDEKKEDDDEKKENQKEEEQKEKGEENKENEAKNIDKDKKEEKYDEINDFLNKVKNFCNYSF
jgi:hypothetical protein